MSEFTRIILFPNNSGQFCHFKILRIELNKNTSNILRDPEILKGVLFNWKLYRMGLVYGNLYCDYIITTNKKLHNGKIYRPQRILFVMSITI